MNERLRAIAGVDCTAAAVVVVVVVGVVVNTNTSGCRKDDSREAPVDGAILASSGDISTSDRPTAAPTWMQGDSSNSGGSDEEDIDHAHLVVYVLRQLLHKAVANIGAISLLRAVRTQAMEPCAHHIKMEQGMNLA